MLRLLSSSSSSASALLLSSSLSLSMRSAVTLNNAMKPKEVMNELDKHIVGQNDAKKAVAIALRNRWRRHQLSDDLKNEVIPKNILMIGPTGCGKTEIARRIAKITQAPFIKCEATKYTEVGFHGKDVDSMIEDLVAVSISLTKKRYKEEMKNIIDDSIENIILDAILENENNINTDRESLRKMLREKLLDDDVIEIKVSNNNKDDDKFHSFTVDFSTRNNPNKDTFKTIAIVPLGTNQKQSERKRMKISDARKILIETESNKIIEEQDIIKNAIKDAEENGIIFIDEIDKIATDGGSSRSSDASSGGVQRDLLPLIEGSVVSTKYGNVKTDFILFIASGAFHSVKPSDLLAELQGRLPIRVTLKGLTENDFYRVLTEPKNNLLKQQIELLKTEKIDISFTDAAIREIARVTWESNNNIENIGARRLHTVIEKIIEQISFEAPDIHNNSNSNNNNSNSNNSNSETIEIDVDYVLKMVSDLKKKTDLKRYVL